MNVGVQCSEERALLFLPYSDIIQRGTAMTTPSTTMPVDRYLRPDWFTEHVFNPTVAGLTRIGVSVWGARVLEVPGRTSGEIRTTPVNLLTIDGDRYLVAPRGETQWVKNVRVAGGCRLRVGR